MGELKTQESNASVADFLEQSEASGPKPWDAVLFAIQPPQPVFFARHARGLRAVIDVSMPCVLDGSVRSLADLKVCDLDGIAKIVESETGRRQATLEAADAIVRARSSTLHDKPRPDPGTRRTSDKSWSCTWTLPTRRCKPC